MFAEFVAGIRVRWKELTDGLTGVYVLYKNGGKRVLVWERAW